MFFTSRPKTYIFFLLCLLSPLIHPAAGTAGTQILIRGPGDVIYVADIAPLISLLETWNAEQVADETDEKDGKAPKKTKKKENTEKLVAKKSRKFWGERGTQNPRTFVLRFREVRRPETGEAHIATLSQSFQIRETQILLSDERASWPGNAGAFLAALRSSGPIDQIRPPEGSFVMQSREYAVDESPYSAYFGPDARRDEPAVLTLTARPLTSPRPVLHAAVFTVYPYAAAESELNRRISPEVTDEALELILLEPPVAPTGPLLTQAPVTPPLNEPLPLAMTANATMEFPDQDWEDTVSVPVSLRLAAETLFTIADYVNAPEP